MRTNLIIVWIFVCVINLCTGSVSQFERRKGLTDEFCRDLVPIFLRGEEPEESEPPYVFSIFCQFNNKSCSVSFSGVSGEDNEELGELYISAEMPPKDNNIEGTKPRFIGHFILLKNDEFELHQNGTCLSLNILHKKRPSFELTNPALVIRAHESSQEKGSNINLVWQQIDPDGMLPSNFVPHFKATIIQKDKKYWTGIRGKVKNIPIE